MGQGLPIGDVDRFEGGPASLMATGPLIGEGPLRGGQHEASSSQMVLASTIPQTPATVAKSGQNLASFTAPSGDVVKMGQCV